MELVGGLIGTLNRLATLLWLVISIALIFSVLTLTMKAGLPSPLSALAPWIASIVFLEFTWGKHENYDLTAKAIIWLFGPLALIGFLLYKLWNGHPITEQPPRAKVIPLWVPRD